MNKAYNRINNGKGWKNYPSDETPLNEQNLNKQDIALDEIDNRVIVLDNTKATKVEVSPLFKEVEYDEQTGIITFTRKNGATVTIDTPMEKIQTGIYYDPVTEMLTLPLIDGTTIGVDLSRLITEYEFVDSDTIAFSIKPDGKVTAIVKEGSIEEKHLRPDYLADIKVEVAKAEASATAAAQSETKAAESETAAKNSEIAAQKSETAAASSATSAENSASMATAKAEAAAASAASSASSAKTATEKASEAAQSETSAATSAETATKKAIESANSATTAGNKAEEASEHADLSRSYAVGTGGEVRENDDTDCAEYYYEQSKRISQSFNGIIPMGTTNFDGLSNADNQIAGYMFNISDSFVSDERFADGGGIFYGAGNNVVYTADGKWDVLAASMVSGVKGAAETEYRQGFVSISPKDIGIENASTEKAGVVKPDGRTIKVEPDGTITGTASGFTGTAEEVKAAIDNGEIEDGTIVNITDDYQDPEEITPESIGAVAKTGDTMTGLLRLEKGSICYAFNPEDSSGIYCFGRICVTGAYVSNPIVVEISMRGKNRTSIITFAPNDVPDLNTDVRIFSYEGADVDVYTWLVPGDGVMYFPLCIRVMQYQTSYVYKISGSVRGYEFERKNEIISELPDHAIKATRADADAADIQRQSRIGGLIILQSLPKVGDLISTMLNTGTIAEDEEFVIIPGIQAIPVHLVQSVPAAHVYMVCAVSGATLRLRKGQTATCNIIPYSVVQSVGNGVADQFDIFIPGYTHKI